MVLAFSLIFSELAWHGTVTACKSPLDHSTMRTWIKFCGTTTMADALASVEAGANALGFIFAPSKRRVSEETATEIGAALPEAIERVGVFADESAHNVLAIAKVAGLTALQLHGSESPELIAVLKRQEVGGRRLRITKTLLVDGSFQSQLPRFCNLPEGPDSILLDSGAGSGRTFDWRGARACVQTFKMDFIIAGGLTPENVGEAIQTFSPWGVDVVSGVEQEPGRKDYRKLNAFVTAVRTAEKEAWAAQH